MAEKPVIIYRKNRSRINFCYDNSGNLLRKYIYGDRIDEPFCMVNISGETETKYYYHYDGLGSVVALSDNTGAIAERYTYDVFGRPNTMSALGNRFMFTGREYDNESSIGLYYYRARFYRPSIGRFLQADPIGYKGGLNLYEYVKNNPVNYTDPTGKFIDPHTAACALCAAMFVKDIGELIYNCIKDSGESGCGDKGKSRGDKFLDCLKRNWWKAVIPESKWEKIIKVASCGICFGGLPMPVIGPIPAPVPVMP